MTWAFIKNIDAVEKSKIRKVGKMVQDPPGKDEDRGEGKTILDEVGLRRYSS
jgi:hypothetical protein